MGSARRRFGFDPIAREKREKGQFRQIDTRPQHDVKPSIKQSDRFSVYNFLRVDGGIMRGPTGGLVQQHAISSGDLDLTTNTTGNAVRVRPFIRLAPESGNSDTLDTISMGGNEFPFQRITLIGTTGGNTITVTHDSGSASGNARAIIAPDDADFSLENDNIIELIFDTIDNKWHIIGGIGDDLGNHTATQDLDMNGNDIIMDTDADSKIKGSTDDTLEFDTGGFKRLEINNSEIQVQGGVNLDVNGNDVIMDTDGDTKIGVAGDDAMEFTTGGVKRLEINNSSVVAVYGKVVPNQTDQIDIGTSGLRFVQLWASSLNFDSDINISMNTGGTTYDVGDSPDVHNFRVGSTPASIVQINENGLTMQPNKVIKMEGEDIELDSDNDTILHSPADDKAEFVCSTNIMQLNLNRDEIVTPTADIARIVFNSQDSGSTDTIFAQITGSVVDETNTSEDGLLAFNVIANGSLDKVINMEGSASGAKLGFFGSAGLTKRTILGARDDPEGALANLLTALNNIGLITDSTTAT